MATVTHVFSIDCVAELLDEDPELLQAIVSNEDNLSYGNIISVYTGPDEAITSLTGDGMEELEQMLAHARRTTDEWNDFLDAFVDDKELITRIKAKSTR
jgi:putative heme iron utilization protein